MAKGLLPPRKKNKGGPSPTNNQETNPKTHSVLHQQKDPKNWADGLDSAKTANTARRGSERIEGPLVPLRQCG